MSARVSSARRLVGPVLLAGGAAVILPRYFSAGDLTLWLVVGAGILAGISASWSP